MSSSCAEWPRFAPSGMPAFGIGTYELRGEACVQAVCSALQLGVRLVDTAAAYRNEELVGQGIRASGVPRQELFIVVKIAMKTMGSAETIQAGILASLQKLGIAYADCVVIHWPGCGGLQPDDAPGHAAARTRCWRVMRALQREGKVRYFGVSNFQPRHFAALTEEPIDNKEEYTRDRDTSLATTNTSDVLLNQIELHPLCRQTSVVSYCKAHHILLQQYSPLGKGDTRLLQHPALLQIQATHFAEYSVPDLLLMWGLSQGYCTLVRSHDMAHLASNIRTARHFFRHSVSESNNGVAYKETRPLLTDTQRDLIHRLHELMHVDRDDDIHLCWNGDTIA